MSIGWIKIHRKLTEWEWYQDCKTKSLFLHLLLKANHSPSRWKGVEVKRGQCITGRKTLSLELGISEMSIRTSLGKLKMTKEITIRLTNAFSIITLCNYESYNNEDNQTNQQSNQPNNQRTTNEQPTSNQRVTTNKNEKKKENEKKKTMDIKIPDFISSELWSDFLDMRKTIKSPMTDKAQVLAFKQLDRFKMDGQDPIKIIEQSIMNSWKGLFEIKNNNGSVKPAPQYNQPPAKKRNHSITQEQAERNLKEAEKRGIDITFLKKV